MNLLFILITLLHFMTWGFMLFAFLSPRLAYINLFYFIPFVYIIQILPFHFFNTAKEKIYPEDWRQRSDMIAAYLVIPAVVGFLREMFEKFSFFNPLSWQGIMIFGAVSSAWSLRFAKRFK